MNALNTEEYKSLIARLDDRLAKAERGEIALTHMLDPKECKWAESYLRIRGGSYGLFGGYEGAERKRAYIFPDYVEMSEDIEHTLEEYGYSSELSALVIKGSGYEKIGHRDVLGAVLGLGIKRSVLGDLCPLDDGSFALFADSEVAPFISESLERVGRDKVRVTLAPPKSVSVPERKTREIKDTVASPRLDAIVAALCSLSREKARGLVEAGLVELDFEKEERPDRTVSDGAVLSVRGQGRFVVVAVGETTRKGRYRLEAKKYV